MAMGDKTHSFHISSLPFMVDAADSPLPRPPAHPHESPISSSSERVFNTSMPIPSLSKECQLSNKTSNVNCQPQQTTPSWTGEENGTPRTRQERARMKAVGTMPRIIAKIYSKSYSSGVNKNIALQTWIVQLPSSFHELLRLVSEKANCRKGNMSSQQQSHQDRQPLALSRAFVQCPGGQLAEFDDVGVLEDMDTVCFTDGDTVPVIQQSLAPSHAPAAAFSSSSSFPGTPLPWGGPITPSVPVVDDEEDSTKPLVGPFKKVSNNVITPSPDLLFKPIGKLAISNNNDDEDESKVDPVSAFVIPHTHSVVAKGRWDIKSLPEDCFGPR